MKALLYTTSGKKPRKRMYVRDRMVQAYIALGDDKKLAFARVKAKFDEIQINSQLKFNAYDLA
jgi:hypothetical protein